MTFIVITLMIVWAGTGRVLHRAEARVDAVVQ